MANSLKVKIGISLFAIVILILVLALETKFFSPITIKRWGKISWDDFQGIPQPFSIYEAAISSTVYIEYDSAKGRYAAYAGQNNVYSWARRSQEIQDYALNHEQYHFNITELHARMLNDYILENPSGTLADYLVRLESIKTELNYMQHAYDNETNHSLIYDKQRRWEYRVDSLLALQNGWLTDQSGAQVYLFHPSDSAKGTIGDLEYRLYAKNTYDMQLSFTSYQLSDLNYRFSTEQIKTNILNDSQHLKAFWQDTTQTFKVFVISEDSSHHTHYQQWFGSDSYLYLLRAQYPNNTGDTTGYAQIASSFINSFRMGDASE